MIISDTLNAILTDIHTENSVRVDKKTQNLCENSQSLLNGLLASNLYESIDLSKDFYFTVISNNIETDITMASIIRNCKIGSPNNYNSLFTTINKYKEERYPHINADFIKKHLDAESMQKNILLELKDSNTDTKKPNITTNKDKDKDKDKDKPSEAEQYKMVIESGKVLTLDENWVPDPTDIKNTFLSLVQKTYPYKTEHQLEPLLEKLVKAKLEKDDFGNYYCIVGDNPNAMFTSHLDTKSEKEEDVTVTEVNLRGTNIWFSNGKTILGADDKAGVTAMVYMISKEVKGLYYFFIGEEVGGLGSDYLASNFDQFEYLQNINKVISFDRRKKNSIISYQRFGNCCSNEFAKELGSKLGMFPDEGGMFTDSANFTDLIPECTNISIGYGNEHTEHEYQNIDFLVDLCPKLVDIQWEDLKITRTIGFSDELMNNYSSLIDDLYYHEYYNTPYIRGIGKSLQFTLTFEETSLKSIYDDINDVYEIISRYVDDKSQITILLGSSAVRIIFKPK